jgi:hypothetical protein
MYSANWNLTGICAFSLSSETITLTIGQTSKFARLLPPPAFAKPSSSGFPITSV